MAENGEGEENLGQVGDQVVVQQDHLVWCEDDKNPLYLTSIVGWKAKDLGRLVNLKILLVNSFPALGEDQLCPIEMFVIL